MNKSGNPYLDENNVPYNKLGITNAFDLKLAEYRIVSNAMNNIADGKTILSRRPIDYGFEHLKAINKYLFERVYDWAGQPRTIGFAKEMDNGMVSVFARPDTFAEEWWTLEEKISAFATGKGLIFGQKVEALAGIFVDANHIHLFPEGNGRTLQVFMRQLAREQGVELDYSKTNAREWNHASAVSGVHGTPYKDAEGYDRLRQPPRNPAPITQIFTDMAGRAPIMEQAVSAIKRMSTVIRQTVFGSDAEQQPQQTRTPEPSPEQKPVAGNHESLEQETKASVEPDRQ